MQKLNDGKTLSERYGWALLIVGGIILPTAVDLGFWLWRAL